MTEETRLIKRIINGEVDAFGLLVERYQRPIMGMVSNILGDRQGNQDIAQDVFFAAYRKLRSFDPARSEFSTWLFTIARNKSLNALKKKKVKLLDEMPEGANCRTPYDDVAEKEFFERLDEKLNQLPIKQKTAFVLAEFEKLPYDQIAQIEGVRIGTIKSRISRAKKKLRSVLKNLDGGEV